MFSKCSRLWARGSGSCLLLLVCDRLFASVLFCVRASAHVSNSYLEPLLLACSLTLKIWLSRSWLFLKWAVGVDVCLYAWLWSGSRVQHGVSAWRLPRGAPSLSITSRANKHVRLRSHPSSQTCEQECVIRKARHDDDDFPSREIVVSSRAGGHNDINNTVRYSAEISQ